MIYEFSQFMNTRYRIPKRQSRMDDAAKSASFGFTRHREQKDEIKHKTEHQK